MDLKNIIMIGLSVFIVGVLIFLRMKNKNK